jgi:hypothetical protein
MAYVTDGAISVNLDSPSNDAQATLGEIHAGNNGSEWVYVRAVAAGLTEGACVVINGSNIAQGITDSLTAPGLQLGFAQTAFASSQFGWVAKRGTGLKIRISGQATTPGVPLYTGNTAGALTVSTNSASAFQIFGVFTTTTVSGTTASAGIGIINFPVLRRPA